MLHPVAIPDPRRERFQDLKTRLHAAPGGSGAPTSGRLSSSIPAVDALLGGGFPTDALVTLEGPWSSGRWSIAVGLLATATRCGMGAVIDDGGLYPPSLEIAGVRLDRLLIVPVKSAMESARAVDLLLRSRVARVVVMPETSLRAAVWTRLAGLAHRMGALLVVVAARVWPELSANATVRLGLNCAAAVMRGARGPWGTFAGFELRVHIRKAKTRS